MVATATHGAQLEVIPGVGGGEIEVAALARCFWMKRPEKGNLLHRCGRWRQNGRCPDAWEHQARRHQRDRALEGTLKQGFSRTVD